MPLDDVCSVQGPELGRKTVGETCKDAGASAGYCYEHVRASNHTPRSDRHTRELALEVLIVMKAVAGPLRAGTWNSEQGSMRCPAVPRTSSVEDEPGGNFRE